MTPGARRALDAASRLFYEHGIHAVGVDRIAAEAGVTKKTLYDRFGSKEQIVVEYLTGRDERWRAFLDERLAAAPPAPAEHVLTVFDASRAWAEANGARGCSMINAHAEIDDPRHPAYAVITAQKAWMLELFTSLVREVLAPGEATASRRPTASPVRSCCSTRARSSPTGWASSPTPSGSPAIRRGRCSIRTREGRPCAYEARSRPAPAASTPASPAARAPPAAVRHVRPSRR